MIDDKKQENEEYSKKKRLPPTPAPTDDQKITIEDNSQEKPANDEYHHHHNRRSAPSNRNRKRTMGATDARRSRQTSATEFIISFCKSIRPFTREWLSCSSAFLLNKNYYESGMFLFTLGLLLCFIIEMFPKGPRYNLSVILAILIATGYSKNFPEKSVRPQLAISILILITMILDIYYISLPKDQVDNGVKALTCFILLIKSYSWYHFLIYGKNGPRVRKYLHRRLRVFWLPTYQPKHPIRELRARILGVEWIEGIGALSYGITFAVATTTMSDALVTSGVGSNGSGNDAGIPLSIFLLVKTITTSLVLLALLHDTDVRVCGHYFGCFGFCMSYIKAYLRRRRDELGGWPLPYRYNVNIFSMITCFKFLDFAWGIAGWVTLGGYFNESFDTQAASIQTVVVVVSLTLAVTDIWAVILLLIIWKELMKPDLVDENGVDVEAPEEDNLSDDSELDDFGIRDDLGPSSELQSSPTTQQSPRPRKKKKKRHNSRNRSKSEESSGSFLGDASGAEEEEDGEGRGYSTPRRKKSVRFSQIDLDGVDDDNGTTPRENDEEGDDEDDYRDESSPATKLPSTSPISISHISVGPPESPQLQGQWTTSPHRLSESSLSTPRGEQHAVMPPNTPVQLHNSPGAKLWNTPSRRRSKADPYPTLTSATQFGNSAIAIGSDGTIPATETYSGRLHSREGATTGNWNPFRSIGTYLDNRGSDLLPQGVISRLPIRPPDHPPHAMILDTSTTITSQAFAKLWESLPLSLEVSGSSSLIDSAVDDKSCLRLLTLALEACGLFPVAVGSSPNGGYRCFVFGVGYALIYPVRVEKYVLCLFELDFSVPIEDEQQVPYRWVHCTCKCSDTRRSAEFVNFLTGAGIFALDNNYS